MRRCRGGRENGQRRGIEVGRSGGGEETAGAAEEKSEEGGGRGKERKLENGRIGGK